MKTVKTAVFADLVLNSECWCCMLCETDMF